MLQIIYPGNFSFQPGQFYSEWGYQLGGEKHIVQFDRQKKTFAFLRWAWPCGRNDYHDAIIRHYLLNLDDPGKQTVPEVLSQKVEPKTGSVILMHKNAIGKSQFGLEIFGVYVKTNDIHYAIGELRIYPGSDSPVSYISIHKACKVENITLELVEPNKNCYETIDKEFELPYLLNPTITSKKYLIDLGMWVD
jgi:hypothetical protein